MSGFALSVEYQCLPEDVREMNAKKWQLITNMVRDVHDECVRIEKARIKEDDNTDLSVECSVNNIRSVAQTCFERVYEEADDTKNMTKYRKKPIVVEAFQMLKKRGADNTRLDWPKWLIEARDKKSTILGSLYQIPFGDGLWRIHSLAGAQIIDWNDWIIQGVKGELYPCNPDIFKMTYEIVWDDQDDAGS